MHSEKHKTLIHSDYRYDHNHLVANPYHLLVHDYAFLLLVAEQGCSA
jgi:hypothetical protein